jgi:hypothetical protein
VKGLNPEAFAKTTTPYLLWIVYRFVKMDKLMSAMPSPKLVRRLKKMAEYARAVETIAKQISHQIGNRIISLDIVSPFSGNAFLSDFINNSSIQRPSPKRVMLHSNESRLTIVNRCAAAMKPPLDQFSLREISRALHLIFATRFDDDST